MPVKRETIEVRAEKTLHLQRDSDVRKKDDLVQFEDCDKGLVRRRGRRERRRKKDKQVIKEKYLGNFVHTRQLFLSS